MSENNQVLIGRVSSNKADKTITVLIDRYVKHETYGKFQRRSSRYYAHDESNQCNIGDVVSIKQVRPISKNKCWELVEVIEKAR